MKNKLSWLALSFLIFVSLVLVSCSKATSSTSSTLPITTKSSTSTTVSSTKTTANWWDKFGIPKYGGTLTIRVSETSTFILDPYAAPSFNTRQMWYDCLFAPDWTTDRNEYSFKADFTPDQYIKGSLAESWQQTDPLTVVIQIRTGVHWQNKAPVNGRELKASDVAQHYNRLAGTGDGFAVPSPFQSSITSNIQTVTADNDKYTVTFKFKEPSLVSFAYLKDFGQAAMIEAPEWVALAGPPPAAPPPGEGDGLPPPPPAGGGPALSGGGPLNDWHTVVGTGPWMLTDFVDGNSVSYVKNPVYWGYDERYPQNKLPYTDNLDVLCIPDISTAQAALRTGKLDILTAVDWRQAQVLERTNSDLQRSEMPAAGVGLICNLNNAPFTDINVRKALQLAVDMKTIAKTHYGGLIDGTPNGVISPTLSDFAYLYTEWPQQLKDEYTYDTVKAKQILADAGFPAGFKTSTLCSITQDLELLQIIKSQFMDVGVDMEIKTMDMAAYTQYIMTEKEEAMAGPEPGGWAKTGMPWQSLLGLSSFWLNPSTVKDPVYDDMCRAVLAATDMTKIKQQVKDADKYILEHHWSVMCCPQSVTFNMYQANLKGYSGEALSGMGYFLGYNSRMWKE